VLRLFRHHIPFPAIALAVVESLFYFAILYALVVLRAMFWDHDIAEIRIDYWILVLLSAISFLAMASVGMYNRDVFFHMGTVVTRGAVTYPIIFIANSVFLFAIGLVGFDRASLYYVICLAGVIVAYPVTLLVRLTFVEIVNLEVFRRRVLVLGIGELAHKINLLTREVHKGHFVVVAFVEFGSENAPHEGLEPIQPYSLLDKRHALAEFAVEQQIDEIVIASRERRRPEGRLGRGMPVWDLLECKMLGTQITDFDPFWEREAAELDLDVLQPGWLIFSDGFRIDWGRQIVKRTFDVLISLAFLLFTRPITLTAGLLVKATSSGPVFYRQERVGLDGKVFSVLKFRSMREDAEKDGVPQWAKQEDDRITAVGDFMRKTRIDELPQVLNVLKGDMSFIGPRPERPYFVDDLCEKIPYCSERHRVKPGISGWAQINYPYGASEEDARRKLAYDLYYVKNRSLFLDFLILIQTVRVILWPDGVR